MKQSIHGKQYYEKDGLKIDNPKDVERKKLENRFRKKQIAARLEKLSRNDDFIDYMYELICLSGYFCSGEGRVNGECYEKKGMLIMGNKIVDDMTFLTSNGINKINALRKVLNSVGIEKLLEEG